MVKTLIYRSSTRLFNVFNNEGIFSIILNLICKVEIERLIFFIYFIYFE